MENQHLESESKGGGARAPPFPVEEEFINEVLSKTPFVKGSNQRVETKNKRMQKSKTESKGCDSIKERTTTVQQRNAGVNKVLLREYGEISNKRSRSSTTSSEVDQYMNLRDKSPRLSETGRLGGAPLVKTVESGDDNGKIEKSNDDVLAEDGESFENPIVPLECFIFL
ncbi:unnamed protein product [Fraxinus pennsylvanica]|uniref:Uncharacterized protein n=1 Tax=Fraxinus pennsylvanica TaxID=56036 RepID=A0AAD1ZN76_9LAMI|nr:unnamed protein product [Fraxinus pennsylvanica]